MILLLLAFALLGTEAKEMPGFQGVVCFERLLVLVAPFLEADGGRFRLSSLSESDELSLLVSSNIAAIVLAADLLLMALPLLLLVLEDATMLLHADAVPLKLCGSLP